MTYRTVLAVVHDSDMCQMQLTSAAQLARKMDAHLEILCLAVDEVQLGYYYAGADAILQQTSLTLAREKADALLAQAKDLIAREDVRWSADAMMTQFGVLNDVVARAAMFADLVVQPRPYGEDMGAEAEAIVEAALFAGQSPVLILPEGGLPTDFPRHAVIGWNSGMEAMSAVRGALPALCLAGRANVAMVEPPVRAPQHAPPGEALCTMLDRHGVKAEISLLPKTMPRVADVLLEHVADQGADLLVTGAYGHSRFRQSILGGATRDLMAKTPVALLMAH
jgi:nucleotide-binding universal stress UspA family protein